VGTSAAAAASAVAAAASAAAALVSENAAAADAIATAADVVQTGLDAAATAADAIATAADRVQTGLDAAATAADVILTNADAVATAADRVQTGLDAAATSADAIATAADRVQTGLDVIATNADAIATAADAIATAADVVQTGLDVVATSADVVQTGLDVTAAAGSASAASGSASAAAGSAAAAAASYDAFDDRYLGDKASDPTLDNDGNALLTGALYFNTTSDVMKVYDGSAWNIAAISSASPTFTGTVTADGLVVNGAAVFNEGGGDNDFRVESDTNTHALFLEGSSGNLGIGTSSPSQKLHVAGSGANAILELQRTDSNTVGAVGVIQFNANDDHVVAAVYALGDGDNEGANLVFGTTSSASSNNFFTSTTERMRITSSGNVGIGVTTVSEKLQVDGNIRIGDTATGTNDNEEYSITSGGQLVISANDSAADISYSALVLNAGKAGGAAASSSIVVIQTNNAEAMRIDSSGTTSLRNAPAGNALQFGTTSGVTYTERARVGINASNGLDFAVNGTSPDVTINTSGYVGIGTSSPTNQLHITATNPTVYLETSGGGATDSAFVQKFSNDFYIWNKEVAGKLFLGTNNSTKLTIDSTGNVGIGTSSPFPFSSAQAGLTLSGTSGSFPTRAGALSFISQDTTSTECHIHARDAYMAFETGTSATSTERMRIDASGNVGIGTTSPATALDLVGEINFSGNTASFPSNSQPRLYRSGSSVGAYPFDAFGHLVIQARGDGSNRDIVFATGTAGANKTVITSSGNVGIGTSSPASKIHVSGSGAQEIRLTRTGGGDRSYSTSIGGSLEYNIRDETAGVNRLSISTAGNVGIGTSSPTSELTINGGATSTDVRLQNTNSGSGAGNGLDIGLGSVGDNGYIYLYENGYFYFATNATERMRIDASGNLLVGKTTVNSNVVGFEAESDGKIAATRSAAQVAIFNRTTSDGDIVTLRKDGTTVGSIGSASGLYPYIGGNAGGSGDVFLVFISNTSQSIRPATAAGVGRDNAIDLGASDARFDDIYATNGTIQTSDRNEKQDIESLSEAEQRVAVAAKGLLRKFRWKSSVEENGDDARIHFGIIAQDLQAAFEAEGLDAGRYAMFIHSTWTDEETGEERSRMGVRYSELLAFIIEGN
jgi:hypothetical protein